MTSPRITVIGGGSVQWSPKIITDIILKESLADATVVIHDIDRHAADRMATYSRKAVRELDRTTTVEVEHDLRASLAEADYVIITISTGGFPAMAHDLNIPEAYGIFHTVGDSAGPGGWSRFVRNFETFVGFADAIREQCPKALILNYTNPLATLTGLLARLLPNPVIGLCHGVFENLDFISKLYDVDEADISVVYGGLNHFYWMTQIHAGRIDVLADLQDRLAAGASLTDFSPYGKGTKDLGGFGSRHELATELFHLTGVLPYLADRHTSEFVPWGITDPEAMNRYGLIRTTIDHRVAMQATWVREVEDAVAGAFLARQLEPTREAAASIIAAHQGHGHYIDVGNTPNRGQISNLPQGVVVETPVRIDPNGLTPTSVGAMPPIISGLLGQQAAAYQLLVDACLNGNRHHALEALRLEPLTGHLTSARVNQLGAELITANETHVSFF